MKLIGRSLHAALARQVEAARRIRIQLLSPHLDAPAVLRGFNSIQNFQHLNLQPQAIEEKSSEPNPLRDFFEAHRQGNGIWKWDHYFDIYHRHFNRFRGRDVHVLEVGIFSGGSLDMWVDYFGPRAHIYGVDLEPACKVYETKQTKIFIGDQSDRDFWRRFRDEIPTLDIVIDDGGHQFEQQAATFEELLPHLRPGGAYLCEDVLGSFNSFACYMNGVVHKLNACEGMTGDERDDDRRVVCPSTEFQSCVDSVHFYPFVTVVERRASPLAEMVAPKRGTLWQPFFR